MNEKDRRREERATKEPEAQVGFTDLGCVHTILINHPPPQESKVSDRKRDWTIYGDSGQDVDL